MDCSSKYGMYVASIKKANNKSLEMQVLVPDVSKVIIKVFTFLINCNASLSV